MSNLIVPCRECGAVVGAGCTYVAERRKGQPLGGVHGIRQVMADEQRTALAIADWLEREYVTIGPDVAAAIRAGEWRHNPSSQGEGGE